LTAKGIFVTKYNLLLKNTLKYNMLIQMSIGIAFNYFTTPLTSHDHHDPQ